MLADSIPTCAYFSGFMAYSLSASKLQTYQRCPQAYYFRYELGLKAANFFGAASLGTALHNALARIYRDWHYQEPLPGLDWIQACWHRAAEALTPEQVEEGREILENYYFQFIAVEEALRRPVAVEGRVQGSLQVHSLEFNLLGRYDRLDAAEEGLELIDYKSGRTINPPTPNAIDLQMGLYYLALEQRYGKSLKQLSLIYLRHGEQIDFAANELHKQHAIAAIQQLALQLRTDDEWVPDPGDHCQSCAYSQYCPAVSANPEPLPEEANRSQRSIQLALNL